MVVQAIRVLGAMSIAMSAKLSSLVTVKSISPTRRDLVDPLAIKRDKPGWLPTSSLVTDEMGDTDKQDERQNEGRG
jgi:hypothetical protein